MNIGERIKKYRKKAGLSQKELGEKLGVSQQHIAQYENGKRIPKIETLKKIASVLDCQVSDIDESIFVITLPKYELTPERLEKIKQNAEAEELINRQASGEELTAEDQQKIADYIERIKDSFAQFPERTKLLKSSIDKIEENILLADYRELNKEGRSEAIKRVNELTEIPRYTEPDPPKRRLPMPPK